MNRRGSLAAAFALIPLLLGIFALQAAASGLPLGASSASAAPAIPSASQKPCTRGYLGCPKKLKTVTPPPLASTASVGATETIGGGHSPGASTTPGTGTPAPAPTGFCGVVQCQHPTLQRVCDEPQNAGKPCQGPPAGCPVGQTRYVYWIATAGGGWAAVVPRREFCAVDPINFPDIVDHVLLGVSPDPVAATVNPFTGALPVTLPVYLWVTSVPADQSKAKSYGTLTVTTLVTNPRFVWYMDDGGQTVVLPATSDPGGPYPDGKIQYNFQHIGVHQVHLQVIWDLVWTAYDPITGYRDGGTKQLEQATRPQFDVNVVEAHALLVG